MKIPSGKSEDICVLNFGAISATLKPTQKLQPEISSSEGGKVLYTLRSRRRLTAWIYVLNHPNPMKLK